MVGMDQCATHIAMLAWAVTHSEGPILEFGMGYYSTPLIASLAPNRMVVSADSSQEWRDRFQHLLTPLHHLCVVPDWKAWTCPESQAKWGLVIVDHAPSARRQPEIMRMKDRCDLLMVHDSEPHTHYGLDLTAFPYRYTDKFQVTWTTLCSYKPLDIEYLR